MVNHFLLTLPPISYSVNMKKITYIPFLWQVNKKNANLVTKIQTLDTELEQKSS